MERKHKIIILMNVRPLFYMTENKLMILLFTSFKVSYFFELICLESN